MADTFVVEIYENQFKHRKKGWVSYSKTPYVVRDSLAPCRPLDELNLPPDSGWCWFSNWKIYKSQDCTNDEGWEYATRFSRFKKVRRMVRYDPGRRRARRRLWVRTLIKETKSSNNINLPKLVVKIRRSLTNVRAARTEVESVLISGTQQEKISTRNLLEPIYLLMEEFSRILDGLQKKNQIDEDQSQIRPFDIVNSFLLQPQAIKSESPSSEIEKLLSISTLLSNLSEDISREKEQLKRLIPQKNDDPYSTPKKSDLKNRTMSFRMKNERPNSSKRLTSDSSMDTALIEDQQITQEFVDSKLEEVERVYQSVMSVLSMGGGDDDDDSYRGVSYSYSKKSNISDAYESMQETGFSPGREKKCIIS